MGTSQSKTEIQSSWRSSPEIQPEKLSPATQTFKNYFEERRLESIYPSPDAEIIKAPNKRPTKPVPHSSSQTMRLLAEPFGPKIEDVGGPHHEKTQIHETANWPNSAHGVVVCTINGVRKWGTGVMIGPNVVLTAGHNLYDHQMNLYADLQNLQFLPGMNGQVLPFGPVEVEQYFVSPNFVKPGKEDYAVLLLNHLGKENYAVLLLKEPIGYITGYFGLSCLEPEEILQKRLNITGYPRHFDIGKPSPFEMFTMEGTASRIDTENGYIHYFKVIGQSGSGVWYQEGDNYYLCGVHYAGKLATLMTRDIYKQIYQWLHQANSRALLFKMKEPKTLSFWSSEMTPECVSFLMKYDLEGLVSLAVVNDGHGEFKAIKELAQNTSWTNLSKLELAKNQIGDEDVKSLSQNTSWVNLSEIDLSSNNIGDEGATALAENTLWKNLKKLNLSGNKIGTEGAKALRENKIWKNIEISGIPEEKS